MLPFFLLVLVAPVLILLSTILLIPRVFGTLTASGGWIVQRRSKARRDLLLARCEVEKKEYAVSQSSSPDKNSKSQTSLDEEWEKISAESGTPAKSQPSGASSDQERSDKPWAGIIGFFHPFCNAGGGGERVLWAAIRAVQKQYPNALCVVYTGDHDVSKEQMLEKVERRFSIHIHPPTLVLLYLSTRHWVLPSTWPRFTLIGQSLGSLVVAYDAFNLLVPDIFIDTMGYAFALAFSKLLFPKVPTAAYVHYPTISTDMLALLDAPTSASTSEHTKHAHTSLGTGLRATLKGYYWRYFAYLYGCAGAYVDIVMTNSSWTHAHILSLWSPASERLQRSRLAKNKAPASDKSISILFPPCPVSDLAAAIPLTRETSKSRSPDIVYIAQFRPEKNHSLVLRAFAQFKDSQKQSPSRLLLVGSVRDDADRQEVYKLRLLAHELHVTDSVDFILDAPWSDVIGYLKSASVGINAMWNEHFGIGVVEYQAAGLIAVVNDSGGPKEDIVVEVEGTGGEDGGKGKTGYHASSVQEYAHALEEALGIDEERKFEMRLRARRSARRFDEASFERRWDRQVERLVRLQIEKPGS